MTQPEAKRKRNFTPIPVRNPVYTRIRARRDAAQAVTHDHTVTFSEILTQAMDALDQATPLEMAQ
jgi:hypothetical protein